MKIVDTNILLYVVNPAAPEHRLVARWWSDAVNQGEAIGFAWSTLLGFVRIVTQPRIFARPLGVRVALDQVEAWLAIPAARIVQEPQDHWKMIEQLLVSTGKAGNLTMDAHLAALAISHNATLVSCDTDFLKFRQVRFENPLATA